jgi:hypothetical protein
MSKGVAFLDVEVQTRNGPARHLTVIITNPDDDRNFLAVPVSTYVKINGKPLPGQDESCLLTPGCHPFIKRKSYALYKKAKAISFQQLYNGLNRGLFVRQPNMAKEIIQDLQRGAELSIFFPEELKRFFSFFLDG